MKPKTYFLLLALEGLLLALSHFIPGLPALTSGAVITFPFAQIGHLLGACATTGALGRGLAAMLLAALALLPCIPALRNIRKKECLWENISLFLMSAMLLPVLYLTSSETALIRLCGFEYENMLSAIRAALCVSVWSVGCCWLAAHLIRRFREGDRAKLLSLMEKLLYAMSAGFVAAISLFCFGDLLAAIQISQHPADVFMSVLRFIASAIPYGADILIVFYSIALVQTLARDGVTDLAVTAAGWLSELSCRCLAVVALSCPIAGLVQIFLMPVLSQIHTQVVIPVSSLVFVLAAMLFSGLIRDNKRLSDDNQLFI